MATFVLVDDSKIARGFLRTLLAENGHEIIGEASNGEEGYEMYAKLVPDVITLDITMPVLNGTECLKKIKTEFPDAKAIMVTSIGRASKKAEALEMGAIGYITKPFNPAEVIEAIDKMLH